MPRRNTEFFIARRISGRAAGRTHIMTRIATVTIAISTAVMIIALAVISGFKKSISSQVTGFGGNVQVVNYDGGHTLESSPITRDAFLEEIIASTAGYASHNAYITKAGIAKTENVIAGIMLKGVDENYDNSFFTTNLTEGTMPDTSSPERTKEAVISKLLADRLEIDTGDRLEMLFVGEGAATRRDLYKVSGIYATGFEELDKIMVITDIRNVRRVTGWEEDQITGYEITTTSFDKTATYADDLFANLLGYAPLREEVLTVTDVTQRFVNLFDWLRAHNVNAAVIITIMLLVSLLNMASALLIILLERTSMIGTLKSLGMTNIRIQWVFLLRSGAIILRGMIWGNVAGIGICLVQKWTHFLKLDSSGYILSEVPVNLGAGWLAGINAGTFLILVILLSLPTLIVSNIRPERTLRYE